MQKVIQSSWKSQKSPQIRSGKKMHTCAQWTKSFSKCRYLRSHLLTHTGEKPHIVLSVESHSVKLELWESTSWFTVERSHTNVPNATSRSVMLAILGGTFWSTINRSRKHEIVPSLFLPLWNRPTLHYAEVEKLGLKWSTLTSHFSAHFYTKGAKFLTGMSELPKNLKKIKKWKLKNNWGKKKQQTCCWCLLRERLVSKKLSQ